MRVKVGSEFFEEQRRFGLRFCCEDCVYLDRGRDRCVHGWPTLDHRRQRYASPDCREVVYCKEFELR